MSSRELAAAGGRLHPGRRFWLSRSARTIFFFTVVLTLAGVFLGLQVPISVFPETNFPRVVIGVDNGVMPVEQMQVTITKPIEDAVNAVPGLETIRSTTSRGSAEVSLFFGWNEDMYRSLQLVDAALSKVQQTLPPTVKITTNRLTFATFPILGYSLTSDSVPQTRLWEIATYDLKPPLNRVAGVSTVTVQGGQVPEFHVVPDPALLQTAGVTIPDLVNAIQASNIVDSPGLYEANHQLILALVGAQVHDTDQLRQLIVKTTAAGVPVRVADVAQVDAATKPVYTNVTANGKHAVLVNIARQPASNTVAVADAVASQVAELKKKLPPGVSFEPFYDQSQLVRDSISSVRDAILIGLVLACIILFLFLRDWTSSLIAGLVIPVTIAVTILVLWAIGQSFSTVTTPGGYSARHRAGHRRRHRSGREHRDAPRCRRGQGRCSTQSPQRDCYTADWFHNHTRGCVSSTNIHNRGCGKFFSCLGRHHDRGAAHIPHAGADMDSGTEPGDVARAQQRQAG